MDLLEHGHNPNEVTRILFQDFPGWMLASFYVVALVAIAVFLYGCYLQVRKYRRGAAFKLAHVGSGLKEMLGQLLAHRSLRRRDALTVESHTILAMPARRRESSCGSTRGSRVALSTEIRTIGASRRGSRASAMSAGTSRSPRAAGATPRSIAGLTPGKSMSIRVVSGESAEGSEYPR